MSQDDQPVQMVVFDKSGGLPAGGKGEHQVQGGGRDPGQQVRGQENRQDQVAF